MYVSLWKTLWLRHRGIFGPSYHVFMLTMLTERTDSHSEGPHFNSPHLRLRIHCCSVLCCTGKEWHPNYSVPMNLYFLCSGV